MYRLSVVILGGWLSLQDFKRKDKLGYLKLSGRLRLNGGNLDDLEYDYVPCIYIAMEMKIQN